MMDPGKPIYATDVPLHQQLYELLHADIVDGLYMGKADFPGEAELALDFGVSVATSRLVLQRLAAEGLVDRGRGRRARAMFVPQPEKISPLTANIDLFTFQLLWAGKAVAPWTACRALDLPPGSILWRCVRLRRLDGQPHSVAYHYQRFETGQVHDYQALQTEPMPRILAAAGLPTLQIDSVVGVARPPVRVSAALAINIWDKILLTTLTSRSSGECATEFARIFFHPDGQHSLNAIVGRAAIG